MLVFAMADDPDRQVQRPVGFRPDVDGSMAVFGTGGSGKSTVLRSLAVAAALSVRLGTCHVYGIDFGSRGLAMLEGLPHVGAVISGDDSERIIRLFRRLRTSLDDRAVRYSEVNAGNIEDFRASTGKADEPRILLLLDGYGAFRNAYETGPENWVFDTFTTLVAGGRSLGIHVVFTADRPTAVPGALQSVVQQRLFLRLASENDIMAAGRAIPKGGFDDETPPGRGYLNELEVQVGTPAAADDAATQAPALAALAATLRAEGGSAAPAVERLPEHVPLSTLPVAASPSIVVGIRDEDLGPFAIDATGLFIIAGPAGSGRRTTVLTIVEAMRASGCSGTFVYFGSRRSYLSAHPGWTVAETEASEIATRAQEIAVAVARDPSMRALVVIDAVGELVNSAADSSLQELARACRGSHTMLVAVGEASDLAGSWPLLQVLRADRRGLLLQPDAPDGESVLRTALPRVNRRDFPAGRGMYVAAGRASRVQIAVSGEG